MFDKKTALLQMLSEAEVVHTTFLIQRGTLGEGQTLHNVKVDLMDDSIIINESLQVPIHDDCIKKISDKKALITYNDGSDALVYVGICLRES